MYGRIAVDEEGQIQKGAETTVAVATEVEKAGKGEGSRGGHVIGHTRSGKAIYASGDHANPDWGGQDYHKDWSDNDHIDAYQKLREHVGHAQEKVNGARQGKEEARAAKDMEKFEKYSDQHRAHREHRINLHDLANAHLNAMKNKNNRTRLTCSG